MTWSYKGSLASAGGVAGNALGRDSDSLGLPNFVSGDVGHLRQSQAVRLSTWRAEDAGADQGDAGRWSGLDEIADALNAEGVKTRSGLLSAKPPKSMSSRAASRHHRICRRRGNSRDPVPGAVGCSRLFR